MLPVIALIGRPNVGKSTLFNRLTGSQDALVADYPGLTRDRQYGLADFADHSFWVIDTGGIAADTTSMDQQIATQAQKAIEEADAIIFMVDARDGVTAADQMIANKLRGGGKSVWLAVNKAEGLDPDIANADFYQLGLNPTAISANRGSGLKTILTHVFAQIAEQFPPVPEEDEAEHGIRIAIIGRPNAGKSTLVNRLMGEERVVASDMAGTTRDSIYIPFERDGQQFTLIDTAGMRRKSRIDDSIEKSSVGRTLVAVDSADIVLALIDAREKVTEQDARLIGLALQRGRTVIPVINKWDGLTPDQREAIQRDIELRLPFVADAGIRFISALHGTGVGELIEAVPKLYAASRMDISTPLLTRQLEAAIECHQPPSANGHRIKMRYAHQGGKNPPVIVIYGNRTQKLPEHYRRYLTNWFRKAFGLEGIPIRLEMRDGENPFAGRKNKLSDRQIKKKRRLRKFTKK